MNHVTSRMIKRASFDTTPFNSSKTKTVKMANDHDKVYGKYKILDAKTGVEKRGKYFVLKIDSSDPIESMAVKFTLKSYAEYQSAFGRDSYAKEVMNYVRGK